MVIIEINNELEVFVQISKTDVGFGNNRGRKPRLLQNPNEVFDICTNTSNKLFISILSQLKHNRMFLLVAILW